MSNQKPLDIVVRALEPDDYDDLAVLWNGPHAIAGSLYQPFPVHDVWRRRLENPDSETPRLVATVDDMVVGVVSLEINEGRRRHSGWVEIAVHDDYQGRGVGAALLTAIIELAEQWLGMVRLELVAFTDNNLAISLYQRFGFEVEGTLRKYAYRQGGLADVYTMARLKSDM